MYLFSALVSTMTHYSITILGLLLWQICLVYGINRAPEFLPGGDMENFSIREDTPVGLSVYTLRGRDPEGTRVFYYISGDYFSVEKETGVVRLIRPLDREDESTIDVIITLADEKLDGQGPNTVSLQREITVLDQNDNPPRFHYSPYAFFLDETTPVGTTVYKGILVTDADIGANADIELRCAKKLTPVACEKFDIVESQAANGRYTGDIVLKGPLDYEKKTTYTMTLIAEDNSLSRRLNSTANVVIEVRDVQDQPPVFLNGPYSATVLENSPLGTSVLSISVRDGDVGTPRPLQLSIENDNKNYFVLDKAYQDEQGVHSAVLETSSTPIDREDSEILNNGGLYSFHVKAVELINGQPLGESVTTNVTIVVSDINDQIPMFNENEFNITIPEDTSNNTALPGLNIVVGDTDVGENAKFSLELQSVKNAQGVFSVYPIMAVGRTPVIIKVTDSKKLDYEKPDLREFIFHIVAKQEGSPDSTATVTVSLSDANDNPPIFEKYQYFFKVPENAPSNMTLFEVKAIDHDSGNFGVITYALKGFGSDKFEIDPQTGKIKISDCQMATCLDYETQHSYSLNCEARDGGGKVSSANVFIEVIDVNDNAPKFTREEYSRELMENSRKLSPPLFVKAIDIDGPTQGGGKIKYSINSSDLPSPDAITIDQQTGEVTLQQPLKYSETPGETGRFSVIIEATDYGNPPLFTTVKLIIKIKRENDGAPFFINEPYVAKIKENAKEGTVVLRVTASDPDGPDSAITYFIEGGAKDNFVVDEKTGDIKVAPGANLDRDIFGDQYHVVVHAVDSGTPLQQTATTTVAVNVQDVNNKPPVFLKESYVQYIPETLAVGEEVINVTAIDPDEDAKIRYSIVEPISARDKTGSIVHSTVPYNFKAAFRIDGTTGQVTLNQALDYNSASVIILTIQAVDLNAVDAIAGGQQKSTAELTIYLQAHSELGPVFAPPWSQTNPKIEITVPEETIIGSNLLTLTARDPLTNQPVSKFEKIPSSDPGNYVSVGPVSGVISLNRRLDFEELPLKHITFQVKAIIGEGIGLRSSIATVMVNVQDINDNSPVFSQDSYMTSISESARHPQTLLTVLASDKDTQEGYGKIQYSVSGDGKDVFTIDETSGTIQIREGAILDREKQAVYYLQVTASDNPGGSNRRRTSVLTTIKILDENDNYPVFTQSEYTAVVPENVPTKFSVATVKATDLDEGRNGEVMYSIVEGMEAESIRAFSVDPETGVVTVIKPLSGKGRIEPYSLNIRATDRGNPPLHNDVKLNIFVGDVSTNDGVPQFIRPAAGEIAYISENATVGTSVFRVVAYDPDSAQTANGKVAYKFLDDQKSGEELEFEIDAATGIIMTRAPLDREKRENYMLIVVAHDLGFPPQEAHRVLRIEILDVDDNDPKFQRPLNSEPVEITIEEELPIGMVVGEVSATDEDKGANAVIDYYITYGNDDEIFAIRRTPDNKGEVLVNRRVDRETKDAYLLTIKVSKPSKPLKGILTPYNPNDLSEMQLSIKVKDIDDNPPQFEKADHVLGVRLNTEVHSELLTLKATDPDITSGRIQYSIKNATFYRPSTNEAKVAPVAFHINKDTGILSSSQVFGDFADGYFDVMIEARNSGTERNTALAFIKIYVLHDNDLLKFIFSKRPNEVRRFIPQFQKDLQKAIAQPVALNIYDTQFYSRKDGSLDFESTGSCFQLLEKDVMVEPKKVYQILDTRKSEVIQKLYQKYSIAGIEPCAPEKPKYTLKWTELFVLVIASIIAFAALVVSVAICCMHSRYKKKVFRNSAYQNLVADQAVHGAPAASILSNPEHQRIYEWQETNAPLTDAASFRSFPTLR